MIVNLVPEFLDILAAPDRAAAYAAYVERHRTLLSAYWHNYVIDLDSAPAREVIRAALAAERRDLERLVADTDLDRLAGEALATAQCVLGLEQELDLYLMVGVGAANAGELVIHGRGVVVLCIEHFTGVANPQTFGLGLAPALLPLWVAHETAHVVRYLASDSRAGMRRLVAEAGHYDCWELASRASLREQLVNEGVAVHAARAAAPGRAAEDYFGYTHSQYRRLRELETFLVRAARSELDRTGLGLRLRWLTGGMSPSARLVHGRVLPERSGYYLGARMTEALVLEKGVAFAARAAAEEFTVAETRRDTDRAVGA